MPLQIHPLMWVAVFVTVVIALDKNVEDWLEIQVKHLVVWIQSERLRRKLLAEIKSIEADFDRYLKECEQNYPTHPNND